MHQGMIWTLKRVKEWREVTFMKEWVKALYIGYHQVLDLPKNLFPFPRTGHLKISLGPTQFLYSKFHGLLKLIFHTNQYNGAQQHWLDCSTISDFQQFTAIGIAKKNRQLTYIGKKIFGFLWWSLCWYLRWLTQAKYGERLDSWVWNISMKKIRFPDNIARVKKRQWNTLR